MNEEELLQEIGRRKHIIVFGAGMVGRTVSRYLDLKCNHDIFCFAVTDNSNNPNMIAGIPVHKISNLTEYISTSTVLVAVSDILKPEAIKTIDEFGFEHIISINDEFWRYMKRKTVVTLEQLENIEAKISDIVKEQREFMDNYYRHQPRKLLKYEVHITEHCNLNCKGCYHFSPVAAEYFLPVEEYEKDCRRLSDLYKGDMASIGLLGGEPLLHPQIIDFFRITRENFPYGKIWLLTNGVLLPGMSDEFWESCAKYKIDVSCTKYPININYDSLFEKAKSYGLNYYYHNDVKLGDKTLIKYPVDLEGEQPVEWNFMHCNRGNNCITLKHGRLYTCVIAAHFHHLRDYFGLDVHLSERDSVDIYNAKCAEEISEFLASPIPFCRYCNLLNEPSKLSWEQSKQSRTEWL